MPSNQMANFVGATLIKIKRTKRRQMSRCEPDKDVSRPSKARCPITS